VTAALPGLRGPSDRRSAYDPTTFPTRRRPASRAPLAAAHCNRRTARYIALAPGGPGDPETVEEAQADHIAFADQRVAGGGRHGSLAFVKRFLAP
jgi:hypothetical protein